MKIMQLVNEDKQMVTGDKNKANLLNHYFSSVMYLLKRMNMNIRK